uniref:Uncharacterized protein n=1 Tax=Ditylum brightwellii TaxID=49249 RepID=A0A6V2AAV8_9STRA
MTIHTKSRCTPHLAVVHNDVDAYHQWTTHFLILHLYTLVLQPIFSFAIHPYLQLAFVLWLSLPRTQGALFIYNKILLPLLDRYERKVDDRIDVVKGELWRMALSSMMSTGFGAANQLGLFLRIVWSGASNPLPYENVENVGHGNVQEHSLTKEEGARKKDPQHSVQDSLSSIRNCDDSEENMNEEEMLTYVRDFVEMLRKGLFVFARIMDNKEVESFSPSIPSDEKNGEKEKKFKLKVFSYEEDIQSFFISPVGSDAIKDSVAIPLNDVEFVASGPQGVAFHLLDGTITAEIVLSDAQDRETLLEGLSVYLALLSKDSDDNSKMGDAEADEDSGSLSATSLEGSVDGSVILPEAMSCNNSDGDVSTNDAERDCNALSLLEKPDDDNVNMGNVESIITPDEGETSAELQTGPDQNSDNADRDEVETSLHHESDIPASELDDNNTTASEANSDRVENMDDISLASTPGPEASELHQTKDTDDGISGGGDQCMAELEAGSDNKESTSPEKKSVEYLVRI